ncbi:hypothetical protein B6I21_04945 [candidate division KSB1 bacterium 4572_119]|nr:MAG: hypothetical protein B6I21_04945 [candidate division KSB1 bacterium 4572_119]
MEMKIEIKNLWKNKTVRSEDGTDVELTILSDINLELNGSCIQIVLGPSGSGKTTLLRMLNKLESPTRGKIYYNGINYDSIPPRELRKDIGMVFQSSALFPGTIFENVLFGPRLRTRKVSDLNISRILKMVNLSDISIFREVDKLSQGQQQRVSLARALANEPKVLLLDEPTSALDPSAANKLLDLFRKINDQTGINIVMVTHIMDHAKRIGDRICLLVDGKIVEKNSIDSFFDNPGTEVAKKFIRGEL